MAQPTRSELLAELAYYRKMRTRKNDWCRAYQTRLRAALRAEKNLPPLQKVGSNETTREKDARWAANNTPVNKVEA